MSVKDASTTTTAEVTVTQLANVVGIPVEKLLQQMQKAGLSHSAAEAAVSDEEKQKLLAFLKQSHGEAAGEQKKITLKRKSVSKIKVAGSQGARGKTVNVEVRKKRTYVKRAEFEDDQEESAASAAPIVQSATDDQQAAEEQRLKAKETKKALDDATKQKEEALRKAAEAKRAAEKEEQRKQELAR
ncbi:MAG TPA: IF-2-associated domain-containing protein, partial [Pseudomonadales bacterium]